MPEVSVRTAAPALLIVAEVEAPLRVGLVAESQADADRLTDWVCSRPGLCRALVAALTDLAAGGGVARSERWAAELVADARQGRHAPCPRPPSSSE